MNNPFSRLGEHLPGDKMKRPIPWKRLLWITAFILGMLAISAGLFYLLILLEDYFESPLEQFALYAYLIVFVTSLISNATIILPAPGLAIALAAAATWNPLWVVIAASIGGVLGETTGYLAGYFGRMVISKDLMGRYRQAEDWMRRYGPWAVFLFAIQPIFPFDLAGMAAGVLRMPLWKFWLACLAGKLPKYFLIIYLGSDFIQHIFLD